MGSLEHVANGVDGKENARPKDTARYQQQAEHLVQFKHSQEQRGTGPTQAVEAKFITPLDPVVETEAGGRLPTIPVSEAKKLNELSGKVENSDSNFLSLTRSCWSIRYNLRYV